MNSNGQPNACPTGSGLPNLSAPVLSAPLQYNSSTLTTKGLPNNMCVLKGFNTTIAKTSTNSFPFGIWFANATTLYVADEGNGTGTFVAGPGNNILTGSYTAAAAQTTAGLQKWVFNGTQWNLAYVLQSGLDLGKPYEVSGYPTGLNTALKTPLPWAPATDGLRNITGRVNGDGTVSIWAITSTVSGSGDQGADPNKLVMITDELAATTLPANEHFATVRKAGFARSPARRLLHARHELILK